MKLEGNGEMKILIMFWALCHIFYVFYLISCSVKYNYLTDEETEVYQG